MKKLQTLLYILVFFLINILLNGCSKCQATYDNIAPSAPYRNPVWYPNGSFLGFNHLAVKSSTLTNPDCHPFYSVIFYADSVGFWLINKDGSNMRKVTNFLLEQPAWSPDGKWIAFDYQGISKMAFDGVNFDTAHIITLTANAAANFNPSWNAAGDSIFFDSNKDAPIGTSFYSIWKMAANGSGQKRITDTSNSVSNGDIREPFCTPDNQVLHLRYPLGSQYPQVYTMDANGNNIRQITNDSGNYVYKDLPRYFNNKIFYENHGVWSINLDGSGNKMMHSPSSEGFSISKNGTIAYVNFVSGDGAVVDKTNGTIWLMDINGNNTTPLTFNNF